MWLGVVDINHYWTSSLVKRYSLKVLKFQKLMISQGTWDPEGLEGGWTFFGSY